MEKTTKKSIIIIGGIVLFLIGYYQYNLCECKRRISYSNIHLNDGIDLNALYTDIDTAYLNTIKEEWQNNLIHIDSSEIETQFEYSPNRTLKIFKHFSHGEKHYGSIIFPKNYDERKKYPLLAWTSGLNQVDPSVSIRNSIVKRIISKSPGYFIVIPSFRGQALVTNQKRYCSDGFFGDAFDGATTDALRLLALAKKETNAIDEGRISVIGMSRGGTVALLMGARDSSINCIVSIAAPTNFYTQEAYNRYGQQYKYQFLSRSTSVDDIRNKMVKSSPLYFIQDFPNPILLIHGKNDKVVNVSHASSIIEKLSMRQNFESIINENGHDFYDWDFAINWIKDRN